MKSSRYSLPPIPTPPQLNSTVAYALNSDSQLRPRLLFLNRSYYPDSEATGQLLTELCEHLGQRFDVTVVAGQPNHNPRNADYRRWGVEQHRGVQILRVWNTRLPKRWLPARVINLLSYLSFAALTTLHLQRRPDMVVVETDPPVLCLLGAALSQRYRCKFVVYLQDLYPDLAIALGKIRNNWLSRSIRRMFLRTYRRADRIVVLSDDMRQVLIEAGIDAQKIVKIPNWIDCTKVHPIKENNSFRARHGLNTSAGVPSVSGPRPRELATASAHNSGKVPWQLADMKSATPLSSPYELAAQSSNETRKPNRQVHGGESRAKGLPPNEGEGLKPSNTPHTDSSNAPFVVMYSGNMGLCQGLENVLAAAELLIHRPDILFMLIGDGAKRPELQQFAKSRNLANVRFLDYQPADELAQSLSAADVHLVPLDPRVSSYLMPSKLYGALASGTPVIAIAPSDCELSRLVDCEEVGYVVEPNRPAELANLVEAIADQSGHLVWLGKRARILAEQQFDRALSVNRFSALMTELVS